MDLQTFQESYLKKCKWESGKNYVYVVGYDGEFIRFFGQHDIATEYQKALLRPERKKPS
ncbi:MAG: hypothetical protein VXZ82_00100 [Planctomycetota bacterium]|nr:hypothetical protein [Planctomycetota bacterium]